VGDLATQQNRQFSSWQRQNLKEGRVDAGWDLGGGSRFDFGGDYRKSNVDQRQYNTIQTLGDWGNANPRDVNAIAPGQVQEFCLVCTFHHHDPKAAGDALISWRTQDATKLYNTLFDAYKALGHNMRIDANTNNRVKENIWAVYGQFTWKGQVGDHDATMVAGARYEQTRVNSTSLQTIPSAVVWQADNDFTIFQSADQQPVSDDRRRRELGRGAVAQHRDADAGAGHRRRRRRHRRHRRDRHDAGERDGIGAALDPLRFQRRDDEEHREGHGHGL